MIIQSPESAMPEPYKTYVRQRSEAIASVLEDVVEGRNVQLCPRAIVPSEVLYDGTEDILYGTLVQDEADGYKSVLYSDTFRKNMQLGIATKELAQAEEYAMEQFYNGNRVRVKDPSESDGKGQIMVETITELQDAFSQTLGDSEMGVVVMPHLETISQRISVGRITLGAVGTFLYLGHEEAQVHEGEVVYGGTTLGLLNQDACRGLSQVEDILDIPANLALLGLKAIRTYDQVALHVGRVSVDVIEGITDNGTVLRDVVDITPRVGGTTPAEVLAIREVADTSKVCLAKSQLIYNPVSSPTTGMNFIDTDTLVINAQVLEVIQ